MTKRWRSADNACCLVQVSYEQENLLRTECYGVMSCLGRGIMRACIKQHPHGYSHIWLKITFETLSVRPCPRCRVGAAPYAPSQKIWSLDSSGIWSLGLLFMILQ